MLDYRDPVTGEPTNHTFVSMSIIDPKTGNYYYNEFPFANIKTEQELENLPYPARGEIVTKLWRQWWDWKRAQEGKRG